MALQVKKSHKWPFLLVPVVIFACISVGIFLLAFSQSRAPSASQRAKISPPVSHAVSLKSDILFLGNTFWGRKTQEASAESPLKYAYPFSRLNELGRGKYDAWISGLECPMKASVHMTAAEQEENLQFNCSPDFLPEAKKWFTALSLANNHTDNQGEDGFKETQQHLASQDIQYFGHYDPAKLEDLCEVISLPVSVKYSNESIKKQFLPLAICAYHGVFKIPTEEAVDQIKHYSEIMPVIAMPHMGAEYQPAPDQIKTNFYHRLVDAGADVVIGDHPHWIQ